MRATAKLVDEADAALQAAQDELDDATETHARALRADTLTRLARALEPAKVVDDELVAQNGRGFGIAAMIDDAQAKAGACGRPVVRDIPIEHPQHNGMGMDTRSVPLDNALREVASGNFSFANSRDERRYAAEVEALRAEIAANKQRAKVQVR